MPQSGGYVGVTRNEGLKRCMMLLVLADLRGFPPPDWVRIEKLAQGLKDPWVRVWHTLPWASWLNRA